MNPINLKLTNSSVDTYLFIDRTRKLLFCTTLDYLSESIVDVVNKFIDGLIKEKR